MTRLVARLLLAVMIFPTSILFFFILMVLVSGRGNPSLSEVVVVWATTLTYIGLYWLWLWRNSIRWTMGRVVATAGMSVGAIALGLAAYLVLRKQAQIPEEPAAILGGVVTPIAWVIGTILLWRENDRERAARLAKLSEATVACPLCGYNMTGLHDTRCPECGHHPTLQEFIASQHDSPDREMART